MFESEKDQLRTPNTNRVNETESSLTIPLGLDSQDNLISYDLAGKHHLLIGGAVGCNMSEFINSAICHLISRNNSDNLKLILIDPQNVDLQCFRNLPHLLVPLEDDVRKAIMILKWATE